MKTNTHRNRWYVTLGTIAVIALVLIGIKTTAAIKNTSVSITVRNDSQRTIAHVYVATGDPNNWGPDRLNGSPITNGGSVVLSDVACSDGGTRVIAEDQNGCFVYDNATCDANQTWAITDAVTPDCGG